MKNCFPATAVRWMVLWPGLFFLALCTVRPASGQEQEGGKFMAVSVEEAREMIAGDGGDDQFVLLDTRTPVEFEKDHLDGAVFLDYSADDFWDQVGALDRTKTYLVYCHDGGRSGKTVEFMKENGFSEAHNMKGGIVAWKRAGYAVERE